MKRLLLFIPFVFIWVLTVLGQQEDIKLTFTGIDFDVHAKLDSIWIYNLTHQCDTMLYWTDTVLDMGSYGVNDPFFGSSEGFEISQNVPNPVFDRTTFNISVSDADEVRILLSDINGREIIDYSQMLDPGMHTFVFFPGNEELYLISAFWRTESRHIKIVNMGNQTGACRIEYLSFKKNDEDHKSIENSRSFILYPGDEMLYVGFHGVSESGLIDTPEENTIYTIQFAANIPCPGIPEVIYEGQTYNTIQIFSQCWLKENLNIGSQIPGGQAMADNMVVEKYCYSNDEANCTTYGGLYQWNEAMQYSDEEGAQGICPEGWHIPTHNELKILEGAVDSQYRIFDPVWDQSQPSWRGYDAAKNLKTTTGWTSGGNGTDIFGFSLQPDGMWDMFSSFKLIGSYSYIWSSTGYVTQARAREISAERDGIAAGWPYIEYGFGVRCLKNR